MDNVCPKCGYSIKAFVPTNWPSLVNSSQERACKAESALQDANARIAELELPAHKLEIVQEFYERFDHYLGQGYHWDEAIEKALEEYRERVK